MPQKCIFKDFCRWHTKRRIDGQALANPNFGMTTTEILNDIFAARNSLDTAKCHQTISSTISNYREVVDCS